MNTSWIFIKRIDKKILSIVLLSIIWIYCYQLWWLNIPASHEVWFLSGRIFLAIAYSVIAGYVIYFITSEYPKIKERIEFNPILEFYVDKINDTKHNILLLMSYSADEYKEMDNYTEEELHADFKQRINERIDIKKTENGKPFDDIFEETMEEFGNVINELNAKSTEHFKYFHKYLTLEIIDILRQIDIHANKIFGTTRGIIAFSEAIGFGGVVKKDNGLIALELASVYVQLNNLIKQVNREVQKYK
jgi:hypothetical protein